MARQQHLLLLLLQLHLLLLLWLLWLGVEGVSLLYCPQGGVSSGCVPPLRGPR